MNKNFVYDFSTDSIKHTIEEEFYKIVGEKLHKNNSSSTIVTGPDFQRHVNNYKKYIGNKKLRICEIDPHIFVKIFDGLKEQSLINVQNKSIELFGSVFIDCDLTCISDLDVIKRTLLKQIEVQSNNVSVNKAFIFSVGLRTFSGYEKLHTIIAPIFGLLGSQAVYTKILDNTEEKKTRTSFL